MIERYAPASTDAGASVLQGLSGACLSDHAFTFYSDLTSTAEDAAFENINPVEAILGTDGLIDKYGGELVRDFLRPADLRRVRRNLRQQGLAQHGSIPQGDLALQSEIQPERYKMSEPASERGENQGCVRNGGKSAGNSEK